MIRYAGLMTAFIGSTAILAGTDSVLWAAVFALLTGWLTSIVDRAVSW